MANPENILIALSDGHGIDTAGKRTPELPNGQKSEIGRPYMNENLFNRAVIKYLDIELRRIGFKTLLVAPTDADTPLSTRTNLANAKNVDVYVSVHANANTSKFGEWGGIETFCMTSGEGNRIGKILHKHVMGGTKLVDRGVKDGSHLWEIRKPNAPAILLELGFMDSHKDYVYLLTDAYRRECAIEIAQGLCEVYGVKYVEEKKEVEKPVAPKPAQAKPVEKPATTKPVTKPAPKPTPKPVAKPKYTLPTGLYEKSDKKSTAVKQIQEALNKLNFKCGTADGVFGKDTEDALKRFQKVNLPHDVDGVYGPATRAKMLSLLNK
jgi:N-acetylmuramoyl-L-alanine amidase